MTAPTIAPAAAEQPEPQHRRSVDDAYFDRFTVVARAQVEPAFREGVLAGQRQRAKAFGLDRIEPQLKAMLEAVA